MNSSRLIDTAALASDTFASIRRRTEWIAEPLEPEDCVIQSMPDVSPTRWHLAHTTWFFETFLLADNSSDYTPVAPEFEYLFNSYYNTVGEQFPRDRRGLLSRPTLSEVYAYRNEVDARVARLLESHDPTPQQLRVLELGLHHEQQHQELMLTDIKHVFSCNPLGPRYREPLEQLEQFDGLSLSSGPPQWLEGPAGVVEVGHDGECFCFDNEQPQFEALLQPFQIRSHPVSCGEYLEFIESGGYEDPSYWLSLGWATAREHHWQAPLHWRRRQADWEQFTLHGWRPLDLQSPVTHISYFEADAFARWSGARLPTECEWEAACPQHSASLLQRCNLLESERLHPAAGEGQWLGDVWEWTSSSYAGYPGYRPPAGAIGEYNGKFMCNQYVLRGGSCATSRSHIRPTYRNFFPPEARWQFSGLRLAMDDR